MQNEQDEIEPTENETESEPKGPSDDDILALARDRFAMCESAEDEIRQLAVEDTKFSIGEQWSARDKADRYEDGRPCLVINRIPQFVRQITNDARQNRPSIKVSPVDDQADIKTAKVYQGLIRHIEYSSDADTAYDRALDRAVRGGFGFFRIIAAYVDPLSYYQELRILSVRNPNSCYLDPSYTKPDGSDATYGFASENMTKTEFKAQWPDAKLSTNDDWVSLSDSAGDWVSKDTCRVADYYYKEYKRKKLVLLSTGETVLEDDMERALAAIPPEVQVTIVGMRETLLPIVHHCKINGAEILERTIWPGQYIPIIPVLGEEIDVEGKRVLEGIVRHAKDPQRMYNYQTTNEAEAIALAPRSPWIGAEGQFDGHKEKWAQANKKSYSFLEYKNVTHNGQQAPPPQRNVYEPAIQAITQARMMASEDMKATTGIYDAAMGAKSNEQSGIAIQRRSNQSQTSNFHFVDNLSKSIRHAGRILLEAIPVVYDTARAVRILGETGEEEVIRINEEFKHKGQSTTYLMGVGKYDVTVDTGPSFETKRQEAVASMIEMSRAYPALMQVAGDLMVKNMDWPMAQELAERIKKTLPPGIADDKDTTPIPPQIKAQMGQMNQMIEQLTEQLQVKTEQINTKSLELESKERIEMAKLEVELKMKMAELDAADSRLLLEMQSREIDNRQNLLRVNEPINGAHSETAPNEYENGDAGQMAAQSFEQQQPTGGIPPGTSMGV